MKKYYYLLVFLLHIFCLVHTESNAQKQVQAKIDSIKTELANYKSLCRQPCVADSNKVNLLNVLAWELRGRKPDTCLLVSNEALNIAVKIKWSEGEGQSYFQMGWFNFLLGKFKQADSCYQHALAIWDKLIGAENKNQNMQAKKAATLSGMGVLCSSQGNYIQAINYYDAALAIDSVIENKTGCARHYGNKGIAYHYLGDYPRSLDSYLRALKLAEEANDSTRISKQYQNIGNLYIEQKDFIKAEFYIQKALRIDEVAGTPLDLANDYGNLGVIYKKKGDYDKALEYVLRAFAILQTTGERNLPVAVTNIGNIYFMKQDYTNALDYYLKALRMAEKANNKSLIAVNFENVGNVYAATKKYADAEKYLLKALLISDSIGELSMQLSEHNSLFKLYESTGNYKMALAHHRSASVLTDSLYNSAKTKELTQKAMQYEYDKKEVVTKIEQEKKYTEQRSEIEKQKRIRNSIIGGTLLVFLSFLFIFLSYKRKRDTDQKQKEMKFTLKVSETEMKALRSQMNPHFIFNALQSIQTFLMNHKPEEANTYLLKFSKLMRLVLENSQYTEVPLKDDIRALELYMQLESIRLPHPFTYKIHTDDNVNIENDTIPPLILQPFVENAIWHGLQYKPVAGHIGILLSKKENLLLATVIDNGVGRSNAEMNSKPLPVKQEPLGMKLTQDRLNILNETKHINASFKITDLFDEQHRPAGTKVEFSLPLVV